MYIRSWLHSGTSLGALKKCACYSAPPSPQLAWILGLRFTVKGLVSMMCFLCPVWGCPGGTELGSLEVTTLTALTGSWSEGSDPTYPQLPPLECLPSGPRTSHVTGTCHTGVSSQYPSVCHEPWMRHFSLFAVLICFLSLPILLAVSLFKTSSLVSWRCSTDVWSLDKFPRHCHTWRHTACNDHHPVCHCFQFSSFSHNLMTCIPCPNSLKVQGHHSCRDWGR